MRRRFLQLIACTSALLLVGDAGAQSGYGWLTVVNGTDHHSIYVEIDGDDYGEVPPEEWRRFQLAAGEHHAVARDGEGRTTGTVHIVVQRGRIQRWTVNH